MRCAVNIAQKRNHFMVKNCLTFPDLVPFVFSQSILSCTLWGFLYTLDQSVRFFSVPFCILLYAFGPFWYVFFSINRFRRDFFCFFSYFQSSSIPLCVISLVPHEFKSEKQIHLNKRFLVTQDLIHERMTHLSESASDHLIHFKPGCWRTDVTHPRPSKIKKVIRVSPDQKGKDHKK